MTVTWREELRQVPQVDQGRDQGVVDRPEEVQGREEVDDPDVDRDEAADGGLSLVDGDGAERHGPPEAAAEDDLLADVEGRQGGLDLDGALLVARDLLGEAVALVGLGREVLDRFEVHEGIREAVVPGVVALVHGAPELLPPERQLDREARVEADGRDDQDGELRLQCPGWD